jgi:hypothetical protein
MDRPHATGLGLVAPLAMDFQVNAHQNLNCSADNPSASKSIHKPGDHLADHQGFAKGFHH